MNLGEAAHPSGVTDLDESPLRVNEAHPTNNVRKKLRSPVAKNISKYNL